MKRKQWRDSPNRMSQSSSCEIYERTNLQTGRVCHGERSHCPSPGYTVGTKERRSHHRSSRGEKRRKRKCSTSLLERSSSIRGIVELTNKGNQQQRPKSPTVTSPGMRVNTWYINSTKGIFPKLELFMIIDWRNLREGCSAYGTFQARRYRLEALDDGP